MSKSHDARAVIALGDALSRDDDPTIRRVSALALGRILDSQTAEDARELALDSLDRAAAKDNDPKVRETASNTLKGVSGLRHHGGGSTSSGSSGSSAGGGGKTPSIFVNVDQAGDQSGKLSGDAADRLTKIVKRKSVERSGYSTTWPGGLPTQAALTSGHARGFIVASTVKKLEFGKTPTATEISCTVSIRIARRGTGTDGGERWEANKAASAVAARRRRRPAATIATSRAACAIASRRSPRTSRIGRSCRS